MKIRRTCPTHALLLAAAVLPATARGALTFTVEANGWDTDARRNAAIAALTAATARFNAFGDFGSYNIYAYYNSGIPTAQASYLGSIGYGGTYPNERVTLHESSHYLGTGTYGQWGTFMVSGTWRGSIATALVKQFEGDNAVLNGDTQHYWPYGLNYDSEGSEINFQREVAMVYALRGDMGIGSASPASAVTTVTLTASDPLGESSFNYAARWSDTHFSHANADYSTGNYLLRTPASANPFTFVGNSLTVNNTNGISGGLLFKGSGTNATTTYKNLVLSSGYARHASGSGDLFHIAGKVTLAGTPILDAAQGPMQISANLVGSGNLSKSGSFPLTLATGAAYAGDTVITAGTLRLGAVNPVAAYSFDSVSGSTVNNTGTGGTGMNGTLTGSAAIVAGGRFGNAVSLSGGASVDINNGILDLAPSGNWTVSAWVKTATPGSTLLSKSYGGWERGNTIFYLGDGSAGGSGGLPSAVRWGGGLFQESAAGASVANNAWHLVTYVNSGGNYALYVDGNGQPLSAGNSSLNAPDFSSLVRLGATTNTVAGDGTVNFNGLLDDVRLYNQALSASQIAALFGNTAVTGLLPETTNVSIPSSGVLDVNGATQQIASLAGGASASVLLGAGRLTVNANTASTAFAGLISGAGGSLVKSGASTLTLNGVVSYTGTTTVNGGKLVLAHAPNASSGLVLNGGTLALAGNNETLVKPVTLAGTNGAWNAQLDLGTTALLVSTADAADKAAKSATLADQLAAGRTSASGITSSTIPANTTLALADNADLHLTSFRGINVDDSSLIVTLAHNGDANLDAKVDAFDLNVLASHWQQTGLLWSAGDFTGDGKVDAFDLNALAANWQFGAAGSLASALAQFPGLSAAVPEPATLALLALALPLLVPRRRRL